MRALLASLEGTTTTTTPAPPPPPPPPLRRRRCQRELIYLKSALARR